MPALPGTRTARRRLATRIRSTLNAYTGGRDGRLTDATTVTTTDVLGLAVQLAVLDGHSFDRIRLAVEQSIYLQELPSALSRQGTDDGHA